MSELDELERDLLAAADTWFSQALHLKLQRLIAIALDGERSKLALHRKMQDEMADYVGDTEPLDI
jgi:hypothetical protein